MSFSISKEHLADIVTATQNRTFDEEILIFEAFKAPHDWLSSGTHLLTSGLNSHLTDGIYGD